MYICNCNGINEKAVAAAKQAGARSALDVYRMNGCKPQCCKCVPEMAALVERQEMIAAE